MPKSRWIIAVAFGLALSGQQARSQYHKTSDQAERAQESTQQANPFSVPVRIIEEPEEAQARQRAEQYSRNLNERDLVAQEGMNRATQSIKDATWWMLWSSVASTLFVAIGTGLLVWTLRLTRHANEAAQAAVSVTRDLGLAEHRPYVDANFGGCISHWDRTRDDKIFWKIRLILSNSGNTPTFGLRVRSCWRIVDAGDDLSMMPQEVPTHAAYLRGHKSFAPLTISIDGDILSKVQDGQKNLFVFVEAKYGTFLKKDESYVSRCGFKATSITGDPSVYWDETNPVSIDWQHVPTYFCYDQECED